MTDSTFIADLVANKAMPRLLALAPSGRPREVELSRVRECATADAPDRTDVERHGQAWTAGLLSLAERAGVGTVERRRGKPVFVFKADRPLTSGEAFDRAWPDDDPDLSDVFGSGRG
jgi:hypothetical protein